MRRVEVSGYDDKGDMLVNRLPDKTVKGLAGRGPDALSGRSFMPRETYEQAVDMNVRGMDKAERCHSSPPCVYGVRPPFVAFLPH